MPLITIWNWPNFYARLSPPRDSYTSNLRASNAQKAEFAQEIRQAVIRAEVPGIDSPELISVCFAGEHVDGDPDHTLIIIVELLNDLPERTQTVRQRLAESLRTVGYRQMRKYEKKPYVEVAVKRFDPVKDGFCS